MDERVRAGATVLILALATLSGCTAGEPVRGPVGIAEARLLAPDTIAMTAQSCNGDPEITELVQDDTQVRVEVTATVSNPGDARLDSMELVLDAPLGDRELVSLHRAQPVVVEVSGRGS